MEAAKFEFFEKVHEGFQIIQQKNPDRMIKIDGSLEPDEVFASLKEEMEKRIKI